MRYLSNTNSHVYARKTMRNHMYIQYDTKVIEAHFISHIKAYQNPFYASIHKSMQFLFYTYHVVRTHPHMLFIFIPYSWHKHIIISMPISSHHSQYIMFLTYVQIHRTYHTNIIYSSEHTLIY